MADTPIQDPITDEAEISEIQVPSEETAPVNDQTQNDEEVIKRLQESLARSQADYQNLLMRVERDRSEMVSFLSGKILTPILSQVDNLERAVKLKEGVEGDAFVE